MIVSILFYIIGTFIAILSSLLSAITSYIPPNIQSSFTDLAGYLGYVSGFIDIPGVLAAFTWYVIFYASWFSFLAIMWVWHKMPWVGKPSHENARIQTSANVEPIRNIKR